MDRAQREFFPHLQTAPGFIGFYLVPDEANGINTAVLVWESIAPADAFESAHRGWLQALDELGHTRQSDNRGDTVVTLEPQRERARHAHSGDTAVVDASQCAWRAHVFVREPLWL